ncbi:hypothetical protein FEM48_Zijuj09G0125300 [Ziziphus jujuba var. spinosa]|uniref:Scopoletin glucosyltransferase-like n=1 Tax=Ziziphus jujuba var. spinosa TaxID=714518 RepID=A0A978UT10_ZIZJJ|nr:hypothetical protein FEM48_Zijuj09G0125300 [Ziziphus jujuba var. spinosa]
MNMDGKLHIFFFPCMAHGHTIPTIDVAKLFASRGCRATIITTSANAPDIIKSIERSRQSGLDIGVLLIKFPSKEVGLPEGCENTNSLITKEMMHKFAFATTMLEQPFEQLLMEHRPACLVSDVFFPWTTQTAAKFGIPRIGFQGISFFALCASKSLFWEEPHKKLSSDSEPFVIPNLPDKIELTRQNLPDHLKEESDQIRAYAKQAEESELASFGMIVNSYYELEPAYADHYRNFFGMKAWHIGPTFLCNKDNEDKATIISTPANASNIIKSIERSRQLGLDIGVVLIKFPTKEVGLPEGCENTNSLTTKEMMDKFLVATTMLDQPLEELLFEHRPTCLVADVFFPWANQIAAKFGIPRFVFNGTSFFALCAYASLLQEEPQKKVSSDLEPFAIPNLPDEIFTTRQQLPDHMKEESELSAFARKVEESELTSSEMANQFASRGCRATIISTPANAPDAIKSIETRQLGLEIGVVLIKFPSKEVGLPEGCENTNSLTTKDMIQKFYVAATMLDQQLEQLLSEHRPTCLVASAFFPWANQIAAKYGIPRIVFHGTSSFALCAYASLFREQPHKKVSSDSEPFIIPNLPDEIKITRQQLQDHLKEESEVTDFVRKVKESELTSFGVIVNSYYELEAAYADHYRNFFGMKAWHPHILFFPFMAHGHMIPTIEIAKIFASRGCRATIISTPANAPNIVKSIERSRQLDLEIGVVLIKFPSKEVGLPEGYENINSLTTIEMMDNLFVATTMLEQPLEQLLLEHRPTCLVADVFFPWANQIAAKFGIPRLVFHGTSFFALCADTSLFREEPQKKVSSDSEPFVIPNLPDEIKITRQKLPDFLKEESELSGFARKVEESELTSFGHIIPTIDMATPFASRGSKATIVTTPYHVPLFSKSFQKNRISGTQIDILTIEFPCVENGLPQGSEKSPSSRFYNNTVHTALWLTCSSPRLPVSLLDMGFLDPFFIPNLLGDIEFTRNQLSDFQNNEGETEFAKLFKTTKEARENSYGVLVNSFYELEPVYADHYKRFGD